MSESPANRLREAADRLDKGQYGIAETITSDVLRDLQEFITMLSLFKDIQVRLCKEDK